jgi:hypothetical protein
MSQDCKHVQEERFGSSEASVVLTEGGVGDGRLLMRKGYSFHDYYSKCPHV